MVYTHVLKVGGGGVRSPVDTLPLGSEVEAMAVPGPFAPLDADLHPGHHMGRLRAREPNAAGHYMATCCDGSDSRPTAPPSPCL